MDAAVAVTVAVHQLGEEVVRAVGHAAPVAHVAEVRAEMTPDEISDMREGSVKREKQGAWLVYYEDRPW